MIARWQELAPRERSMLVLGAAALALGLAYALVWHPLAQGILRNEAHVAQQRADLAWMQQAALQMHALRSQAGGQPVPRAKADQPLHVVLNAALRAQGLDSAVTERTQDEDGSIRLTFKAVPFDALLRCLASLQAEGLQVQTFDLDRVGAGQVAGSLQVARVAGS